MLYIPALGGIQFHMSQTMGVSSLPVGAALQPNSFHHLEHFPECLLTLNFLLIVYPLFLLKGNLPKVSVV